MSNLTNYAGLNISRNLLDETIEASRPKIKVNDYYFVYQDANYQACCGELQDVHYCYKHGEVQGCMFCDFDPYSPCECE